MATLTRQTATEGAKNDTGLPLLTWEAAQVIFLSEGKTQVTRQYFYKNPLLFKKKKVPFKKMY